MLIGMTEGTLNPLTVESFSTNIRASSIAFCWNFSSVTFGSVAPIVSIWLIEKSESVFAVTYYLITVCIVTVITMLAHIRGKGKWSFVCRSHSEALRDFIGLMLL